MQGATEHYQQITTTSGRVLREDYIGLDPDPCDHIITTPNLGGDA